MEREGGLKPEELQDLKVEERRSNLPRKVRRNGQKGRRKEGSCMVPLKPKERPIKKP